MTQRYKHHIEKQTYLVAFITVNIGQFFNKHLQHNRLEGIKIAREKISQHVLVR